MPFPLPDQWKEVYEKYKREPDLKTGQLKEASAIQQEVLDSIQQLSDPTEKSSQLGYFGVLLFVTGEEAQGRAMLEQGLSISERLGDIEGIGTGHMHLAWIEEKAGNTAAAIAHYREALARLEQIQSPHAEDIRDSLRKLGTQP